MCVLGARTRTLYGHSSGCVGHFVLTHLLLDDLKKSAGEEDGDARVVVVTSSLHDVEHSKKRGRELYSLTTLGQLSLASLRGRLIEYQLRLG